MDRLIRALQRGGSLRKGGKGDWLVWRGRDSRTRSIGTIPAAQVDVLRAEGSLGKLGDIEPQQLVWSGPYSTDHGVPPSAATLERQDGKPKPEGHKSLLARVLKSIADREIRSRLSYHVGEILKDLDLAAAYGAPNGMNWQAITSGARIERSGGTPDHAYYRFESARASARLQALRRELTRDEAVLFQLVFYEQATRYRVHQRFGGAAKEADARTLKLIHRLQWLRDHAVASPLR